MNIHGGLSKACKRAALLAVLGVAMTAVLVTACGGGDGGGGGGGAPQGLSEGSAAQVAERFVLYTLQLFTGDANAKRFIEVFAPECRENVKEEDITLAITFIRAFMPDLAKMKFQEVDLGKLVYERTSEGILVRPESPDAIRVKVGGKFVLARDLFADFGFEESDSITSAEPILIVERNGRAYVGECDELGGFSLGD
jgi:hypothetical protein